MKLHLVRHLPVAKLWQKRCYGRSDPGLLRSAKQLLPALVDTLAALKPDLVIHSDMVRTRAIAEPLAAATGCRLIADPAWRERDFGTWEGQSWHAIYRATGSAMEGMITEPDSFRPGGGETTRDVAVRVADALDNLLQHDLDAEACVIVISHGGPIACALAQRAGIALHEIATLIPATGSITQLYLERTETGK